MRNKPWTDDEKAELRRLWVRGFSAQETADALGKTRSRNAIVGAWHRMGLFHSQRVALLLSGPALDAVKPAPPRRGRPPKVTKAAAEFRTCYLPKARPLRSVAPAIAPTTGLDVINVPFVQLQAWQCKAVTDPTRFAQRCCGAMRVPGSPYCEAHKARFAAVSKER